MRWRKRFEREANSITDPLERRIFIRSQQEHRRRAASDAFWDSAWTSTTLRGHSIAAIPIYIVAAVVWAIFLAVTEEVGVYFDGIRDGWRKRRHRRYAARARRSRTYRSA